MKRLDTYEHDDQEPLSAVVEGLADVLSFAEALQVVEKYGLSLLFDAEKVEWNCVDPQRRYCGNGNTPSASVIFWNWKREDDEGADDQPKLKLATSSEES